MCVRVCVCVMKWLLLEFLGLVVFVSALHFAFFGSFCLWTPHFFFIVVVVFTSSVVIHSLYLSVWCWWLNMLLFLLLEYVYYSLECSLIMLHSRLHVYAFWQKKRTNNLFMWVRVFEWMSVCVLYEWIYLLDYNQIIDRSQLCIIPSKNTHTYTPQSEGATTEEKNLLK